MNTLAKVLFGSRLYGTDVPTSDLDYRGLYLPPIRDCILGRVRDAWEDKSADDTSWFSLQHFCRLAGEGQSIAVEMLAAPPAAVIQTSPVWDELQRNRHRFYTRSMHSFLGYAKTMAGKYSARIDRLQETEAVMVALKRAEDEWWQSEDAAPLRLRDIWDKLPVSPNAEKTTNERQSGEDKRAYRVCGRELQASVTISHAHGVVKAIFDNYGERVRRAKEGQIEWKSMAHAFRAALQCREIVTTGDLHFPLRDAEWLRQLRLGQVDFFANSLDQRLDELILETQQLMDSSTLPEKADAAWVDQLIVAAYDDAL